MTNKVEEIIGDLIARHHLKISWHEFVTEKWCLARGDFITSTPWTLENVHVLYVNRDLDLEISEFGIIKLKVNLKEPDSLSILSEFLTRSSVKPLSLIVAHSLNRVIGKGNKLPWHLPEDLKRFKAITTGRAIIMGRSTWESIGSKPLPKRDNIILTRNPDFQAPGGIVVHSPEEALEKAYALDADPIVIGGEEIYKLFLPLVTKMYITRVNQIVDGDAFFPEPPGKWDVSAVENFDSHAFIIRDRVIEVRPAA